MQCSTVSWPWDSHGLVVGASNWCAEGHEFDSCQGLRLFFLAPCSWHNVHCIFLYKIRLSFLDATFNTILIWISTLGTYLILRTWGWLLFKGGCLCFFNISGVSTFLENNKTKVYKFIFLKPNKTKCKVNMNKALTLTVSQEIKFEANFETELMLLLFHAGLVQKCFWGEGG